MKTIFLATILIGLVSAFSSDIKPPEYKQVTIIGVGATSFDACNDANTRMYNSKKRFTDQTRVDLRPLPNGGYISIITRTEKIIH